ncbi:primosomal protein N' (replication factor Y) [Bacillus mesophilus]|uniref:Replication restart protein PriA n=1 Tax=Bacillus mesophilus TaxID=1808955 RepID=A0A6M0Q569_9BACI|nr:primosomal protein N' [Bacillus mesophilus]MBM7659415.1 primosomal protein N' (replication factor Y) [Bacillus mesophilus]NEY70288.1 primosomal protein N' [Bacillus mesophilus]
MNIAKVIVDVPARQTDRAFDYLIPEDYYGLVQPGVRVIVPFGPRSLQGFVVGVESSSNVEKLKAITQLLDIEPILNEELLQLGKWVTEQTLSYQISSFQAMLPAALKAKYEKEVELIKPEQLSFMPVTLQKLFQQSLTVSWGNIENEPGLMKSIQKEIGNGNVEVNYVVKARGKKKTHKVLFFNSTNEEARTLLDTMSSQAARQKEVIEFFLDKQIKEVPRITLKNELSTTDSPIKALIEKGILTEKDKEIYRDPHANREFKRTQPLPLTEEQSNAIIPILHSIEHNQHQTYLLYGVTGSGKTEVYLQSIEEVLKKGQQAIVLVPEISLTPQMVERFKGRFGSSVAVLHSGLSIGEKYDEWRKIYRKEVNVVVGARSAVFAPFENLGIIIIDEEHESSYKQEENPRYHARDVAIYRGSFHQCPVVLGSATPTLETFARAKKGLYELLPLSKRMHDKGMPAVDIVDMREELREGNRSMFSSLLFEKLQDRLEKKEQTVLFLNRRGYSTFIMCRDCGFVVTCPECDISLTYHRSQQLVKCHYCGYEEPVVKQCPSCQSDHIRFFGTGTQKVEEEIGKLLPEARIIRMDVDTTSRKGSHEKLLTAFGEGKADILLGTQMIAKGLDFPRVTLVGVLTADTMLHLPDFRSSEKTFQLLTQVSGRAGRHELPGEVVIQTYTPEHYSVELASQHNYQDFYLREMGIRKLHQYPPFFYVTLITVSHPEITKVVAVTEKISTYLRSNLSSQTIVLGPAASPIPRIKNRYRYQCMIKYKDEPQLRSYLKDLMDHYQKEMQQELQITIDMNPYMIM